MLYFFLVLFFKYKYNCSSLCMILIVVSRLIIFEGPFEIGTVRPNNSTLSIEGIILKLSFNDSIEVFSRVSHNQSTYSLPRAILELTSIASNIILFSLYKCMILIICIGSFRWQIVLIKWERL